jgi:hypothetical protein
VSRDYLSFGLKFITMLDMDNAKKSIIESIKIYPLYLLNLKVLISLILIFIPISMSEYILIKFNKISIGHKNDCNW